MRLAVQTVLCCCAFSALLLAAARGATGESDTRPEQRFKAWLQSRVKRDIHDSVRAAAERLSDGHAGPRHEENASVSPPPSCSQLIRSRRSTSKPTGCRLVTCVYHDLIFQLHQSRQIKSCVPVSKIGPGGFGRRRRSVLDDARLAPLTRRQRRSTEDGQRVRRHKSTRTVA